MKKTHAFAGALVALGLATGLAALPPKVVLAEQFDSAAVSYVNRLGKLSTSQAYATVDSSTTQLVRGWYVVDQDVVLTSELLISGNASLVLSDGATLHVPQGIVVEKGSTLTLYPQEWETGSLVVEGGVRALVGDKIILLDAATLGEAGDLSAKDAPLQVAVCAEVRAGDNESSAETVTAWKRESGLFGKAYLSIRPRATHDVASHADGLDHDICSLCGEDASVAVPAEGAETGGPLTTYAMRIEDVLAAQEAAIANGQNAINAQSNESTVTISFDANGGSGTMSNIETTAGSRFVLPECTFTPPEGKVFETWSMGNPGDSVSVPISTTIRAFWKADTSGGATGTQSPAQGSEQPSTTDGGNGTTTNAPVNNPGTTNTGTNTNNNTSTSTPTIPSTTIPSTTDSTSSSTQSTTNAASPATGDPQTGTYLAGMAIVGATFLAASVRARNE